MRAVAGFCATGFLALISQSAFAADQCGPLKIVTSLQMTPVERPGNVETIPVTIGSSPRRLLVDTGSFQSIVTKRTVRELNLPTTVAIAGARARVVSGATSDTMAQLPSITIGNLHQEKVYFFVLPGADDPNNTVAPPFDGILGQDLFQKVDVDLDYGTDRLALVSQDHCPGNVVYWTPPGPVAVIPFEIDQGGHIILQVELDGKRVRGFFDTGASNTNLSLQVAQKLFTLDVNAPDVEKVGELRGKSIANIYRHRFRSITFGGVAVSNPSIDLLPASIGGGPQSPPTGSLIREDQVDMLIGMSVISKLHVYIANRERKLYVTAAADTAQVQHASLTQTSAGSNFSGSWKIASQPVRPVCEITQTGNELKGSCVGTAAKGDVTGTVAGQTVRWQWKRIANNNGNTSLWNFSGTMGSDNSITGFLEQNGRSAPFTATKQ